jgi:putative heme-binding domain-containing protein
MKPTVLALFLALGLAVPPAGVAADSLPALVRLLGESRDAQVQVDVLRGLRDAFQGPSKVPMPEGWQAVEARLAGSESAEVRSLARMLGLKFGSPTARAALRDLLKDRNADMAQRQEALRALAGIRDDTLPATLRELLKEPALRGAAVRSLAAFDDPANGPALLAAIPSLGGGERRDALNTLASRPATARTLLAEIEKGAVPKTDLTAEVVRQLRNLKDDAVNAALTRVYGAVREVAADKQEEIARFKRLYYAGGSTPGDAIRGRAVYAKVCQQCHTLFDVGGKVGPDLTGSNRGDLDYILQNILDPNAVIPNEYRASTLEMKDGRVITGIVKQQDDRSVVVAAANETLTLARSDVQEVSLSQLSMMPEGLVQPLAEQEYRDLIYYLSRSGQAPMLATADTVGLFFNGHDLALWQGTDGLWSVDQGMVVGRSEASLSKPEFLKSDLIAGDFRLVARIRRTPDAKGGSFGLGFRGEPQPDGSVKGYRLVFGAGRDGQIEESGGRGALGGKVGEPGPASEGWTTCEVLAVGNRLRTAVNGRLVTDLQDAAGARQGLIAFVLASGMPGEVRVRDLKFEIQPKPGMVTVTP